MIEVQCPAPLSEVTPTPVTMRPPIRNDVLPGASGWFGAVTVAVAGGFGAGAGTGAGL